VTAEVHPRAIFRRAIERKSLLVAQMTAHEMGVVGLDEALELVVLTAELDPQRFDAYARRFVARLADERSLTLGELDLAITALRALPSARAGDVLRQLLR
jgi:hypothetical protein